MFINYRSLSKRSKSTRGMDEQKSNCEENDSEPTGTVLFENFSLSQDCFAESLIVSQWAFALDEPIYQFIFLLYIGYCWFV